MRKSVLITIVAAAVAALTVAPCAYFVYQMWSVPEGTDTPGTDWFAIGVGDVDGDGFGDLALSLRFDPVTETDNFTTWIVSGHEAKPLYTIRLDRSIGDGVRASDFGTYTPAGHRVTPRDDQDGDGLADLGVHCRWTSDHDHERIVLLSGKDGRILGERTEEFRFGRPSAVQHIRTVDIDGDGYEEFVDNARSGHSGRARQVEILSGKAITAFARAEIDARCQFMRAFELAGDVDGDDIPEIALTGDSDLVASGRRWKPAFGVVTIHSGKDGSLLRTIDRDTLRQWSALDVPSVVIR